VHRVAIELINPDETEIIVGDRAARQAWLQARGYRVVSMAVADVEGDLAGALDQLDNSLAKPPDA
jgi:tRNA/rRNA methyltransferase